MKHYFQKQIQEIQQDRALHYYGMALAGLQVVAAVFWITSPTRDIFFASTPALCWPFFQGCEALRVFNLNSLLGLFGSLLVVSSMSAYLFSRPTSVRSAYWMLLSANILKAFVLLIDYRSRMNEHFMAGLATVAFLFIPNKRRACMILTALFYFWFATGTGIKPIYHVELVLVWGLFARRPWIFWGTLVQLLALYLYSFPIIGFLSPLHAAILLSVFVLDRLLPPPSDSEPARIQRPAIALILLFVISQTWQYALPGDTNFTGEGRIFGLQSAGENIKCETAAFIRRKDSPDESRDLRTAMPNTSTCDPYVTVEKAKRLCKELKSTPNFIDFDLSQTSKKSDGGREFQILNLPNFCSQIPDYSIFRHNSWIAPPRQ